jgi:hypothetical protein
VDNSQGIRQMKFLIIVAVISLAGIQCSNRAHAQANIMVNSAGVTASAPTGNSVYIDQVGTGNTTTVIQDGTGHRASITAGDISPTDYNVFSIVQQGAAKTANIELKAGINNTFNIQQDGTGNHTASIQNMIGSGNNISLTQSGAGNHTLTVTNPNSATNNGNTVTATQTGGVGADKTFNLQFNGATGAGVTINQTNPTQPDQGGMNIQCNPCGSGWSYTKF